MHRKQHCRIASQISAITEFELDSVKSYNNMTFPTVDKKPGDTTQQIINKCWMSKLAEKPRWHFRLSINEYPGGITRNYSANHVNANLTCLILAHEWITSITVTPEWARWRLKSPASPLFTQSFIQVQIKENIKAPRHWPLCGEFTSDCQ